MPLAFGLGSGGGPPGGPAGGSGGGGGPPGVAAPADAALLLEYAHALVAGFEEELGVRLEVVGRAELEARLGAGLAAA